MKKTFFIFLFLVLLCNPALLLAQTEPEQIKPETDKFEDFQKVLSIQYYLLVESRWQSIILYSRTENPNLWTYQLFNAPNDVVGFSKLGFELSLETIYKYVNVPQFATIPHYQDDDDL